MMFALLTLQSAIACGPYGGFAMSDNGAWAYENDDVITVHSADGERVDLPIYGELVDMDFVGDELVVAYQDKTSSFAVLFDADGVEVADWSPNNSRQTIGSIMVLPRGLMVTTDLDGYRQRVRLTDDLEVDRRRGARTGGFQRP